MYFEWIRWRKNEQHTRIDFEMDPSAAVSRSILFVVCFSCFLFMNTIIWFDLEMAFIVKLSIWMLVYANILHIMWMWSTYTASLAIVDRIGTCCVLSTKCPSMQMILNLIYCRRRRRRCCWCCYCLYACTLHPKLKIFSIKEEKERQKEQSKQVLCYMYFISIGTIFEFYSHSLGIDFFSSFSKQDFMPW